MKIMTTVNDLRNWVDTATADWTQRGDTDVETIKNYLRSQDECPAWGADWADYLDQFDLETLV